VGFLCARPQTDGLVYLLRSPTVARCLCALRVFCVGAIVIVGSFALFLLRASLWIGCIFFFACVRSRIRWSVVDGIRCYYLTYFFLLLFVLFGDVVCFCCFLFG